MLPGKTYGFNVEGIDERESYFEAKDQLVKKKCIEMVEKLWSDFLAVEGNDVDE